jgi:hypothetical protein
MAKAYQNRWHRKILDATTVKGTAAVSQHYRTHSNEYRVVQGWNMYEQN